MAYQTKQFSNGEILTHDHMNNIIDGIDELKNAIKNNNSAGSSSGNSDFELYTLAKNEISRFQHQSFKNTEYESEKKVDIAIFAGQSNSCGRATLDDVKTSKDVFLQIPIEHGFTFNNTSSSTPVQIVEPISANGSTGYGYIPAFINSYYSTTGRKICACYKSEGGVMLNTFSPYVLDNNTGQETATVGRYYKNITDAVKHAKDKLVSNGYEVGDVFLVWCQGEADAAYLGVASSYTNKYEETLTTDDAKQRYYKERFIRLIDKLKEDIGLTTAFIIRIGHSKTKPERNTVIIEAQNQLCREHKDCVMASTLFAGALYYLEEDGTKRDLMRDGSHYVPEGYLRAGVEAGTNAGIYNKSNKMVKPILIEYHTMKRSDTTEYERPIDKFIYDPCRIDINYMMQFTTLSKTTAISIYTDSSEIGIGGTTTVKCNYSPANASDRSLNYVSSDNSVATVDSNGVISGISAGTATITASLKSDASITSSLQITINNTGGNTPTTGEAVEINFDFTANNINDYSLDGIFSIPSNSTPTDIEYDSAKGMSLNNNLPNGLNLTKAGDASKPWSLEFTATIPKPTAAEGNRKAIIAGNSLAPFVFINFNAASNVDSMGFQIADKDKNYTWVTDKIIFDTENTYKFSYNGNGTLTMYVNGELAETYEKTMNGEFNVILGNYPGQSTAYVWKNVESSKSYLKKFKFNYISANN